MTVFQIRKDKEIVENFLSTFLEHIPRKIKIIVLKYLMYKIFGVAISVPSQRKTIFKLGHFDPTTPVMCQNVIITFIEAKLFVKQLS